ncbi:MAG: nucleotide pyrophosphohydrolase [Anaerolineae bacterium]
MDLRTFTAEVEAFIEEMGWAGPESPWPRTPRNLATSVMIEAAELLQHFQWGDEVADLDALGAEMADVLIYLVQLAAVTGIDLDEAARAKLAYNRRRFAPSRPAGSSRVDNGEE